MTEKPNENYYSGNQKYTDFLEHQHPNNFKKYVDYIEQVSKGKGRFLDVGCGTGIALGMLKTKLEGYGVEISDTSVKKSLNRKINCQKYDGRNLPFTNSFFDVVGSYNVLEHTDNPLEFLKEQKRVLKNGGLLIVVCPNFLSITNSYHTHTAGIWRKLLNLTSTISKLASKDPQIQKMSTIDRESFQPDDDACNVTNPIDIIKWAKRSDFRLKYWSSRTTYQHGFTEKLDRGFLKVFLGSSFLIFEKS